MNLIVWLLIGGFVGWLASLIMRIGDRQGIVMNVAVGVVGAFLAGWFVAPLVGIGLIDQINFSGASLLISLVGALLLLGVVNLLRPGTAR